MERSFWDDFGGCSDASDALKSAETSSSKLFTSFIQSESNVPDCLPVEVLPHRHQLPDWGDSTIQSADWLLAFRTAPKLTQLQGGIRSQKVNQNLSEIANAIAQNYELLEISGCLAVYQPPAWRILRKDSEVQRFIVSSARRLFPSDVLYLSKAQFQEIGFQLLYHDLTEHLEDIPAADYRYLCCQDGMYDWHTGELLPHSSTDYRFSALHLRAGEIGSAKSAYWEGFLNDLTMGDDTLKQRVLELIGVILTGFPSKNFFLLQGASGTGKSQLVNFLRSVLGKDSCVALNDISQLGEKWTTGSIFGKLLCLCGDVPNAPLTPKAIGAIKQLTGDDLIRGEFKYESAFFFENTAKLLFVSNYPLQISNEDQEDALLDRLMVVPCMNPVPKERQIKNLHRHLHDEAGYIIQQSMEALIDLEARNGIFTPLPDALEYEAVRSPDSKQLLRDFVKTCCQLGADMTCTVEELFQAFREYEPACNFDVAKFSKLLCRIFPEIRRYRTGKVRGYQGIQLKNEIC